MKHLELKTDSGSMEVTMQQNDVFNFEIDEPWAGDSETGFGRTTSIYLSMEQAIELKEFLNKLI